ncbi:MAG: hypothetical protein A3E87_01305 [Gammaproteobacteria bacterium RIFCSPHIGHO2_12_FULL_35_23]|nr:MAG: hypothetical protein A3E87_01305 [Gammaproteobacteria bacterium RIFCSPHIGHO2_12_FULL_35_23]
MSKINRSYSISKTSFLGAAMGTMVEYYDYALFALFLPIIAPIFFAANTAYASLVKGYYILMIAMIARPIGGLLFGYIGDLVGRRKALVSSIYGIAMATLAIGVIPSYHYLGFWSAILILIAKSIQLLCFGGEYNGAGIYVVEHAQGNREALLGSFLTATTLLGALLATFIGVILTLPLMPAWSWRVAFILGGLLGLWTMLYRKNLLESPNFRPAQLKAHGLVNLFKLYPRELVAGIFVGGFSTLPFTTVLIFINPVLMTQGYLTSHELMLLQCLLVIVAIGIIITAGHLADKFLPTKVMQVGVLFLAVFSYSLLRLIDSGVLSLIIVAELLLIVFNEILLGPSNAYLKNLFSEQYRYRGASLSFCLGMSLIGGLTPVIENYFYRSTGSFGNIIWWLLIISLGTFASLKWVEFKNFSKDKREG